MKISMKLVYQDMAIFLIFLPISNHLHQLQVENRDSNSRLVVDEDDNGEFRFERVNIRFFSHKVYKGRVKLVYIIIMKNVIMDWIFVKIWDQHYSLFLINLHKLSYKLNGSRHSVGVKYLHALSKMIAFCQGEKKQNSIDS